MMRIILIVTFVILAGFSSGEDVVVTGSGGGVIKIAGLGSVPADDVREWIGPQISFIESAGVSMARADDAAYFLENALRQHGYNEAVVDWKLVDDSNGKQQILLTVDEGAGTMVGKITVEGNAAIEDDAVIELLTSQTRKRFGADPRDAIPFVSGDLDKGIERVREFYELLGFPKVRADFEHGSSDSRLVDIKVSISEGVQYQVGRITLPESPAPKVAAGYGKIEEDFAGKSFSAAVPATISARLTALARDVGFYDATVTVDLGDPVPAADGKTATIDLAVAADWGPSVPISKIMVSGNEKVNDRFFDRHFEKLAGQPYSPNATNSEVEELLRTGAFESVRTDTVRQEDGSIALNVAVEEAPSRQLGVYGGFATYEGPIAGFEFRNLNLLGSVRKVDAEAEISRRGLRGEIEYEDPWFAWSDYRLRSTLFAMNRLNEGYSKFETGGRYEFSRKLGQQQRSRLSLFGQASYTDVYEADIDRALLGDLGYFANSTGISYSLDRRDNPRKPRSGFIAETSVSVASSVLASEVEFLRATGRLGFYLPLGETTLRLSARVGTISPIGDTSSLPIDLRFYNGGAQTVRSFQERELGPRDSRGYPVGGEFYTIFNFEYEIPFPWMECLSVVPFADAGNLLGDSSAAGFDEMRYAIGLGLRYETPIGPLRVEYGLNPDPKLGESQGTTHVGLGVAY